MRSFAFVAAALAATAAATPMKRDEVIVTDTAVDFDYVTDVVTVTAGQEAATTSVAAAAETTTVAPSVTYTHYGHHRSWHQSASSSAAASSEASAAPSSTSIAVASSSVASTSEAAPSTSAAAPSTSAVASSSSAYSSSVVSKIKQALSDLTDPPSDPNPAPLHKRSQTSSKKTSSTSTKKSSSTKTSSSTKKATSTSTKKPSPAVQTAAKKVTSTTSTSPAKKLPSTSASSKKPSSTPAATKPTTSSTTAKTSAKTTTKKASTTSNAAGAVATTYQQVVLDHHNVHRANHSASAVTWDTNLASIALSIAQTCVYEHNTTAGGGGYGQNIAAGVPSYNISAVITELFYNGEVNWFNGLYGEANPDMTNFEHWGHFSQIVWKGTTTVGCATYDCSNAPSGLQKVSSDVEPYFTVCNYGAPGKSYMAAFSL